MLFPLDSHDLKKGDGAAIILFYQEEASNATSFFFLIWSPHELAHTHTQTEWFGWEGTRDSGRILATGIATFRSGYFDRGNGEKKETEKGVMFSTASDVTASSFMYGWRINSGLFVFEGSLDWKTDCICDAIQVLKHFTDLHANRLGLDFSFFCVREKEVEGKCGDEQDQSYKNFAMLPNTQCKPPLKNS